MKRIHLRCGDKGVLIMLRIMLLLLLSSGAAHSQHPPQTPQVEPQKQANRSAKAKEAAESKQSNTGNSFICAPTITCGTADPKTEAKREHGGEEASEFWTVFGRRLKVTDSLLAAFTLLLFCATLALCWATQNLVRGAKDTAKKELRAYVAIGKKGLYSTEYKGVQRPKMQIDNSGNTPAKDVTAWKNIVDKPPAMLGDSSCYCDGEVLVKNIMLHPRQELPLFWADNLQQREGKFLFGYIEYTDIYERRWRFRFAYQHMSDTWYQLYQEHNNEIEVTAKT